MLVYTPTGNKQLLCAPHPILVPLWTCSRFQIHDFPCVPIPGPWCCHCSMHECIPDPGPAALHLPTSRIPKCHCCYACAASHTPGPWPRHIYLHTLSPGPVAPLQQYHNPVSQPPHISHTPVAGVTTALYFPIPQTLALCSLCTCSATDNGVTITSCASVPLNCHHHIYTCDPDTDTKISLSTPAF